MATRPRLWTADDLWHLPGFEKIEMYAGHPTGPKAMHRRLSPFRRSMIEFRLIQHLTRHVVPRDLGLVGPGFGFVGASGRALHPPDLVFLRKDRIPAAAAWDGLSRVPPDLAVEVLSPVDEQERVAEEIAAYLGGGVPLLWVVDPAARTIAVHASGQAGVVLTEGGDLDGGRVLPGFSVPIGHLFS
jgi:Uma2 family endonuclease